MDPLKIFRPKAIPNDIHHVHPAIPPTSAHLYPQASNHANLFTYALHPSILREAPTPILFSICHVDPINSRSTKFWLTNSPLVSGLLLLVEIIRKFQLSNFPRGDTKLSRKA